MSLSTNLHHYRATQYPEIKVFVSILRSSSTFPSFGCNVVQVLPPKFKNCVDLQGADYSTGLDSIWLLQPQLSCADFALLEMG